ncbi:MAG: hypothetical protein ACTSVU_00425 [Promethearchaeota archaeon]
MLRKIEIDKILIALNNNYPLVYNKLQTLLNYPSIIEDKINGDWIPTNIAEYINVLVNPYVEELNKE